MDQEKKPALEDLAKRVEELLTVLNYVAKDLGEVSAELKEAAQSLQQTAQPAAQPPSEKPAAKLLSVEEVAAAFPEDLQKLLKFEDKEEFVMVKPSGFLGSENFARIAEIVRNRFNGDYVSLGKESHFRVPKKQEVIEN